MRPQRNKKRLLVATLIATSVLASSAFATLIPLSAPPTNVIPASGSGLGSVNSLVTFQNTGTETGAVGVDSSGATITGSSVAYFNGTLAAGATYEQTGSGNNTYTLAQLGTDSFSNVVLIFNGSEPQNAAAQPITLEALSLNIFSATGVLLGSFGTNASTEYMAFPGVGNAGFAYKLDEAQAALANALITPANASTLRIGGAARVSDASGGLETVFISTLGLPATRVPDAGATVAMLGFGIGLVGCIRRFRR